MTKRLQVVFDAAELREIQRTARRRRMTVAEWVRQALRHARSAESGADARTKLDGVRTAARNSYPTGDVEQVLDEIERGYSR